MTDEPSAEALACETIDDLTAKWMWSADAEMLRNCVDTLRDAAYRRGIGDAMRIIKTYGEYPGLIEDIRALGAARSAEPPVEG
jgi:hypothetical protein